MPEKRFFKLVHAQARRNAREAVESARDVDLRYREYAEC